MALLVMKLFVLLSLLISNTLSMGSMLPASLYMKAIAWQSFFMRPKGKKLFFFYKF